MMRSRYGYNCQKVTVGGFDTLTPLGFVETVPGETVAGTVSVDVRSYPVVRAIDTRQYVDCFAFYVPYRLLWSGWPDFITKGVGSIPTVSDLAGFNFESRFLIPAADGLTYDRNNCWFRRCTNLVYRKFFSQDGVSPANLDAQPGSQVWKRPSALERAALRPGDIDQDTLIPVTGGNLSLNDLRQGLSEDAFSKMRAYYGDRYIDYLAAVGVKTDWAVLEEPELVSQCHHDFNFKQVAATITTDSATTPNQLGKTAGWLQSRLKAKLGRVFSPEHGLIALYLTARADPIWTGTDVTPVNVALGKTQTEEYWSPERNNLRTSVLNGRAFLPYATPAADTGDWQFRAWDEMRHGLNEQINQAVPFALDNPTTAANMVTAGVDAYRKGWQGAYDSNFVAPDGSAPTVNFQVTAEYRLVRHSPIPQVGTKLKLT